MPETKLKVCVQQPSLAAYRVPLFQELAAYPDIDLQVYYAKRKDLPNVEAEHFEAIPVTEKSMMGGKLLWSASQLNLAGKRNSCDGLVLSANLRYASLLPSLKRARRNGIATVSWSHHYSKGNSKIAALARKKLFRDSDAILCYSHGVADKIRKDPAYSEKTFVAPNSLCQLPMKAAISNWTAEPGRLQTFRDESGLQDSPNILFVSRIKPRNKLEVFVETVKQLRKSIPNIKGTIIGAKNEYRDAIERLVQQEGLQDSFLFPGAIYDEEQLAPWFLNSVAFLYPSQIGLSIFHAFNYGLPVVAGVHESQVNPELEALVHGQNGYRFDEDNPREAAEWIMQMINNAKKRKQISDSAMKTVDEHFNMKTMASHFRESILFANKQRQVV